MKASLSGLGLLSKQKLFWVFHISGWVFVTLVLYAYFNSGLETIAQFYRFLSYYAGGFLITLALRSRLRKVASKDYNLFELLLIIFLFAFASTIAIYLFHFITSLPSLKAEYSDLHSFRVIFDALFWKYLLGVHTFIVFLIVFLWLILYFGLKSLMELRAEREAAKEAQMLAQKAQLEMLRYQLNPHFLFNSLNSIWALVDDDPGAVKKMVNELSDFLRYSLLFDHKPFKPLSHEIEALKNYFSIEKKRFQEKLIIDLDIAKDSENCRVLSFILQPFVENAIKFGMLTSEMPLRIGISSRLETADLVIAISNTGRWVEPYENEGEGIEYNGTGSGIRNATSRLDIAYPGQYQLLFEKLSHQVTIKLVIRNITSYEEIPGTHR